MKKKGIVKFHCDFKNGPISNAIIVGKPENNLNCAQLKNGKHIYRKSITVNKIKFNLGLTIPLKVAQLQRKQQTWQP